MDCKAETLLHIKRVNELLIRAAKELMNRAMVHDDSKLKSPEVEYFDEFTPQLQALTYGSSEYAEMLKKLKPALDHHYANNTHHPQHYPGGVNDMDLFDVLEMLLDWKASCERQCDGNILCSLEINKERFKIDAQLAKIMKNTVERYLRK